MLAVAPLSVARTSSVGTAAAATATAVPTSRWVAVGITIELSVIPASLTRLLLLLLLLRRLRLLLLLRRRVIGTGCPSRSGSSVEVVVTIDAILANAQFFDEMVC